MNDEIMKKKTYKKKTVTDGPKLHQRLKLWWVAGRMASQ